MPERIGEYQIQRTLGRGGMGLVYLGYDEALDRRVAIKVLTEGSEGSEDRRARFKREARTAARLSHPNIAVIHSVGETVAGPYIAMEYIDGPSWRDQIIAGTITSLTVFLDEAAQVADGLAAAHEQGVIHRDLKPDNVMVDSHGRARIVDFGLAKGAARRSDAQARSFETAEGHMLGTPGYMAPEQILGEPVDARADIFAFGAMLYEMLSGRFAFSGNSAVSIAMDTVEGSPTPLSEVAPHIPASIVDLVMRCLERRPEERPQQIRDVRDALRVPVPGSDAIYLRGTPDVGDLATLDSSSGVSAVRSAPPVATLSSHVARDSVAPVETTHSNEQSVDSRVTSPTPIFLVVAIALLCVALIGASAALVATLRNTPPTSSDGVEGPVVTPLAVDNASDEGSAEHETGPPAAELEQSVAEIEEQGGAGLDERVVDDDLGGLLARASGVFPGEGEVSAGGGYAIGDWERLPSSLQGSENPGLDEMALVAFSPDGRFIARGTDTGIQVSAIDGSASVAIPEPPAGTLRRVMWPSDAVGIVAWTATRQNPAHIQSDPVLSGGEWSTYRFDLDTEVWEPVPVEGAAFLNATGELALLVERPNLHLVQLDRDRWQNVFPAPGSLDVLSWTDDNAFLLTTRVGTQQSATQSVAYVAEAYGWASKDIPSPYYRQPFTSNAPAAALLDSRHVLLANTWYGRGADLQRGESAVWVHEIGAPDRRVQLSTGGFASYSHLHVLGDAENLIVIALVNRVTEAIMVQTLEWRDDGPHLVSEPRRIIRGRGFTMQGWVDEQRFAFLTTEQAMKGQVLEASLRAINVETLESEEVYRGTPFATNSVECDGSAILFRYVPDEEVILMGVLRDTEAGLVLDESGWTIRDPRLVQSWGAPNTAMQRRCGENPGFALKVLVGTTHYTTIWDAPGATMRNLPERDLPGTENTENVPLSRLSPDGTTWAVPGPNQVSFVSFEGSSEARIRPSSVGRAFSVMWAPDSSGVLVQGMVCGVEGSCLVWVGRDGTQRVLQTRPDVIALADAILSPDGSLLAWDEFIHRRALERFVVNRPALLQRLEEAP